MSWEGKPLEQGHDTEDLLLAKDVMESDLISVIADPLSD